MSRLTRPTTNRRHLLIGAAALTTAGLVTGAGAAAAWESGTVRSYGQGLWWCLSLLTTEGFGAPFASLFVREDELPDRVVDQHAHDQLLAALERLNDRFDQLERSR